eukprot:1138963-Pelagomonas_calceolata.AAC.3
MRAASLKEEPGKAPDKSTTLEGPFLATFQSPVEMAQKKLWRGDPKSQKPIDPPTPAHLL